ncbi:glycosyltransferase [Candidatus Stoquefichus sp. SB1]|uniref:glycosyltransferase n=1 Tax=Candidatus Stoquefichus sp. SB1 TaxID=1658109 RepID=UPI00067EC9B1|nr:glycosyltransferase [Candidatus Stoquefichus sp. SB1]
MSGNVFVAGVTLYNPDYNAFERIREYAQVFDYIYVFDNTELSNSNKDEFENISNIIYLSEYENMGLPYAFNKIISKMPVNVNYLCTLDQDSIFSKEDIKRIIYKINHIDMTNIAIMAPKVIYHSSNVQIEEKLQKRKWVITSGSFLNIRILKQENIKYDENYFIDKFEIDLCQQLINKNYIIYQYNGSLLHQRLGEDSGHMHPNHNPIRHYYLFRNRFYFNKKYVHSFIKRIIINFLQTARHIFLIVLYENKKKKKLSMLMYAWIDYKKGEFGKGKKK